MPVLDKKNETGYDERFALLAKSLSLVPCIPSEFSSSIVLSVNDLSFFLSECNAYVHTCPFIYLCYCIFCLGTRNHSFH
jgi:hypothetical protein